MLCTAVFCEEYDVECDAVYDGLHDSRSHVRRRMQKAVRFGCALPETEQRNGYHKRRFFPNIFLPLQRQTFPSGTAESEASVSGVAIWHLVQS